jgi:Mlc titration factor MtfA (ptsG expression regulator)
LPGDWTEILDAQLALWRVLDDEERDTLEGISDWLLRHKHWEAAYGAVLTDEIRVTVAALAAVPIIGRSIDDYREVSAVIVYPTTMRSGSYQQGPAAGTVLVDPLPVLGEAHQNRGPVILAWDQAQDAANHPGRGSNVVFHEFAHKLDMVDHLMDGTPQLDDRQQLARWIEVCTEAFNALRAGIDRPPLSPYGATNPAEFFAVATESFFDAPVELERAEPSLYDVLRDYFNQDPAAWSRRDSTA